MKSKDEQEFLKAIASAKSALDEVVSYRDTEQFKMAMNAINRARAILTINEENDEI